VRRRATAAVLICLLLAGASGCGSGRDGTSGNPRRELRQWYVSVEESVAAMESKQRGFTQFSVSEPPQRGGVAALSPAGAKAGEEAADAAAQLDTATTLTAEEAGGLYCYFFAFYVDLESSPAEEEFEAVILNLVKKRLSPSASPEEIRESAAALREAMIAAEKAGARSGEVAAAISC
jgi:hypothetical protein